MMQQILQFFSKIGDALRSVGRWGRGREEAWKQRRVSRSLKKKSVFCSANAALVSVAVHLFLLLFAGSIVAIRYAQKQESAFAGENIVRPKLERRQLQMPVRAQNLQKKSQKPKVTSRMATAAPTSFALPDMSGLGLPGQAGGFGRVDVESEGRSLGNLGAVGSLGFGLSTVNFFGARSSGEKMVFVINASKLMLEDNKGGFFTYQFVKDRIHQMVSGMRAATLFNVVLYSGGQVAVFSPDLIPASQDAKTRLLAWLQPINDTPARAGIISDNYKPSIVYDSPLAGEAINWVKAVQIAMEQGADNIFILSAGWEGINISPRQREKLFGVPADGLKKFREERGWPQSRVDEYERKLAENTARAKEILAKENEARAAAGMPPKIIQRWHHYVYEELGFPRLEAPPHQVQAAGGIWQYEVDHILAHLNAIYQHHYVPKKLARPKLHFICLIAEDGGGAASHDFLRRVASAYRGGFDYLRGAKSLELLVRNNPAIRDRDPEPSEP